jgi:glycosyltransferase involved in cell wall biosynthesis
MPMRLVERQQPLDVGIALLNLYCNPALAPIIDRMNLSPHEVTGYVLLYLLRALSHSSRENCQPDAYIFSVVQEYLALLDKVDKPRRVLVVAYACEPGKGSEPAVGWNMAQTIARSHETWVITRANNRHTIEKFLAAESKGRLHFVYVDLPPWLRFWKRRGRGVRLYYYLWQFAAWHAARRIGKTVSFDVAHHVTFVQDWAFSCLAFLPYPFVWGPIGSHSAKPATLIVSWHSWLADRGRSLLKYLIRLFDPMLWFTAMRADVVVGIDCAAGGRPPLSLLARRKLLLHPAIGIEPAQEENNTASSRLGDFLNVVSAGRLIDLKGFDLTVLSFSAFAREHSEARLTIIGDGPERSRLEKLAASEKAADRIIFSGWMCRAQYLSMLAQADVFLFPSCEGGGMVALEAMAGGVPVICLDKGGPSQFVTDETGVVVPVRSYEETVADLSKGILMLASDPERRAQLSRAARARAQTRFLWTERAPLIASWYMGAILSRQKSSPLRPRQPKGPSA